MSTTVGPLARDLTRGIAMFRRLSVQEKRRCWSECLLGGSVCLLIVQIIFTYLWPACTSAGLPLNFGMMMPLPSTRFSPGDIIFLRSMASGSAFFFLGPALVLLRNHLWVSLFALGPPWGLMAGFSLMSPTFPGGLASRLLNIVAFVGIGLMEWAGCVGIFYLLRRMGVQMPSLYIK